MAIEAGKITEKDELIARFYALRAGLSAIAEESKKIHLAENELNLAKEKNHAKNRELIAKYDFHAKAEENAILSKKRELEDKEHSLRYESKKLQERKNAFRSELASIKNNSVWNYQADNAWKGTIFFIILGVICFMLCAEMTEGTMNFMDFLLFLTLLAFPWVLLFLVPYFIKRKARKNRIAALETEIRGLSLQIQEVTPNLQDVQNELKAVETLLEKIKNKRYDYPSLDLYQKEIATLEHTYKNEIIPSSTTISKSIKNTLNQQFSDILTEADWENVDLLIFYLNTGRADSLKEALLLVDKQKQTDQIARAIGDASRYISDTIHDNTFKLASVMTGCFSNLSKQINANHKETMQQLRRANDNLEYLQGTIQSMEYSVNKKINQLGSAIVDQNQLLVDSNRLNTALLEQANRSSEGLMNELRYNQKYWIV